MRHLRQLAACVARVDRGTHPQVCTGSRKSRIFLNFIFPFEPLECSQIYLVFLNVPVTADHVNAVIFGLYLYRISV